MRIALATFLVVGVAASARGDSVPRVLVPSGTVVGDLGVARFTAAVSLGRGRVAFRASSERLVRPQADGERTIVSTGDALPPPSHGTFNSFIQSEDTGTGQIVFEAALNDADADVGLFTADAAGHVERIEAVRRASADATPLSSFSLATSGDVSYATDAGVFRWSSATRTSTVIEPLAGTTLVRGPVVSPGGALVAWVVGSADGPATAVRRWSAEDGAKAIAEVGGPSPLGPAYERFAPTGLDASDAAVAFFADVGSVSGAFVWHDAGGDTEAVARTGDLVDGDPIVRFRGPITLTADGRVFFRARFGLPRGVTTRSVVAANGELHVVDRRPSRFTGTVQVNVQEGLYLAYGKRVKALVRVGDTLAGGHVFTGLSTFAGDAKTVAFVAELDAARRGLFAVRGDRMRTIATDGDAIGPIQTLTIGFALDVRGRGVVFGADPFTVVRRGRKTATIAPPDGLGPDPGFSIAAVRRTSHGIVAGASASVPETGAVGGIYVAKGSKFVPLIAAGDRLAPPASITIDDVATVVPAHRAVAFVGVTAGTARIFVARGRRVVHLSSITTDSQNGSVSHSPYDLRFDGRRALFREAGTIYEAQEASAVAVLAAGAATPAGTLDATDDGNPKAFALADGELVVSSRLFGGNASEALVALDLGRR